MPEDMTELVYSEVIYHLHVHRLFIKYDNEAQMF